MTRPSSRSYGSLRANLVLCKYEIMKDVFAKLSFGTAEDDEPWDILWTDLSVSSERLMKMKAYQRINHFPGMMDICRKGALARNMKKMAAHFPDEYTFCPQTWLIPSELDNLLAMLRKRQHASFRGESAAGLQTYIVKPDAGAMGIGIYLAQTEEDFNMEDLHGSVVQSYVPRPLLVDGLKFDLRIYVLVTCVDPLQVYIYEEGIARFATMPYEAPNKGNIKHRHMHLTNYSVNKHSDTFVPSGSEANTHATKRLLSSTFDDLRKKGRDMGRVWRNIGELVVKTLLPVTPLLAHTYSSSAPRGASAYNCFELLGFDVLLDAQLQPWLMEVNHSPSFSCDSQLDVDVKTQLIADTITSLGLKPGMRQEHERRERKQLNSRLYQPKKGGFRSQLTRNRHGQLVFGNGDELGAASGGFGGWGAAPPAPPVEDDCGLIIDPPNPPASTNGRFSQIYPPPDGNKELGRLLSAAARLFEINGCVCRYCARQQQLHQVSGAVMALSRNLGRGAGAGAGAGAHLPGGGRGEVGVAAEQASKVVREYKEFRDRLMEERARLVSRDRGPRAGSRPSSREILTRGEEDGEGGAGAGRPRELGSSTRLRSMMRQQARDREREAEAPSPPAAASGGEGVRAGSAGLPPRRSSGPGGARPGSGRDGAGRAGDAAAPAPPPAPRPSSGAGGGEKPRAVPRVANMHTASSSYKRRGSARGGALISTERGPRAAAAIAEALAAAGGGGGRGAAGVGGLPGRGGGVGGARARSANARPGHGGGGGGVWRGRGGARGGGEEEGEVHPPYLSRPPLRDAVSDGAPWSADGLRARVGVGGGAGGVGGCGPTGGFLEDMKTVKRLRQVSSVYGARPIMLERRGRRVSKWTAAMA